MTTTSTLETLHPQKVSVKPQFSLKNIRKFEALFVSFRPFHGEMAEARARMADGSEFFCLQAFARAFGRRPAARLCLYQQTRDRHLSELLRYQKILGGDRQQPVRVSLPGRKFSSRCGRASGRLLGPATIGEDAAGATLGPEAKPIKTIEYESWISLTQVI